MSSIRDRTLLMRRVRLGVELLVGQLLNVQDQLNQARDIVLAVRNEVRDARGTHPTVADRLTALEAQLPPTP